MATQQPKTINEYRDLLAQEGEVSIGAFARQRRRRRIWLGVCGVTLIAGAYILYQVIDRSGEVRPPVSAVLAECTSCHLREQRLPTSPFPLVCTRCGQKAVFSVMECRICGNTFIATGASGTKCPRCGSARIGSPTPPTQPHP